MTHYLRFTVFTCLIIISSVVYADEVKAKKGKYYKQEMTIGGVKRNYYVYIPASHKEGTKSPAVIAFHGFQSDANGLRWLIKPDSYAEKYGFIMIYPNALNKSWNVGKGFGSANKSTDDNSFAAALADVVTARHPIDKKRLYVMGFSNGAQMANLMLCKVPHKITAIAMVSHTMNIKNCNPKLRVPVAMIHGQKDTSAPINGGGKFNLASHKASIDFFREVNEIKTEAKTILKKKTVNCQSYEDPSKKVEVISCICSDSGHSWPGGVEFMVETLGTVNKEIVANEFIFDFFTKHKTPPTARSEVKLVEVKPNNSDVAKSKQATQKSAGTQVAGKSLCNSENAGDEIHIEFDPNDMHIIRPPLPIIRADKSISKETNVYRLVTPSCR